MSELHFANPGQENIDPAFAALLGEAAKEFGGLRINSGRRSAARNKAVGGAKGSHHLTGNAADIDMSGLDEAGRQNLVKSLLSKGAKGFITYSETPDMLHVDMREGSPHFMHDKSAANIKSAPGWFQALAFAGDGKDGKMFDPIARGAKRKGEVEGKVFDPIARGAVRKDAAETDPVTGHANVPVYQPPGVEGYNPETGEIEKTGIVDKLGAFFSSAVEGMPIVGPTVMSGLRQGTAHAIGALEGEDPAEVAATMQRGVRDVQEDNPVTSMLGSGTGAVVPMLGLGATGLGARALGITGNSLRGRTLASGVSNALIAGTDTAVRGGDVLDTAKSAGISGLIGLAIPGAGVVANSIGRAVKDTVAPRFNALVQPAQEAARRVGNAMTRDAKNSAAPLLNQADEASAALNNQQLLNVDRGGETARALARSASNADPEARALIEKTASDRFAAQGDRARSFIDRLTGGAADDVVVQEQLRNAARAANKPAYERAFSHPAAQDMATPGLMSLLRSPAIRTAASGAEKRGANRAVVEGFETVRNPFVFDQAGNASMKAGIKPTLQFWDQVKRNLDSDIGVAQRAGDRSLAADLTALKSKLVTELDAAVPSYKTARAGAAAFFDAEDALDAGKKFVTMNRKNSEVAAALKKMAPAERATFAVGFASEMKDAIKQAGDRTNVINKIFGSEQAREKVALALGPKATKEFESFVRVEHAMDMLRHAMGNSKTAQFLIESTMAGSGTAIYTGDWQQGITAGLLYGLARKGAGKVDERVTKRIAELLLSDDPAALKRAVTIATNSQKASESLKAIQTALGSALRGIGTDAVRPERQPLEITVGRPAAADAP